MKNIFINKEINKDYIVNVGGILWNKDGKNLAYFNHIGIWLMFEKNSNSYTLNKKPVDKFNGEQIYNVIKNGKLWFDFKDNAFKSKIRNTNLLSEDEILSISVRSILTAISEISGSDYTEETLIASDVDLMPMPTLPPLPNIPF